VTGAACEAHHAGITARPRMCSGPAAEHAVYTDAMIETWLAIVGLLLFGCFVWWITTGTGYWARLARSSHEPATPRVKALWWIAYAVTALWVLSNSSCEGPGQLGRNKESQPRQHAREVDPGRGGAPSAIGVGRRASIESVGNSLREARNSQRQYSGNWGPNTPFDRTENRFTQTRAGIESTSNGYPFRVGR
jgi:hypothetical protein